MRAGVNGAKVAPVHLKELFEGRKLYFPKEARTAKLNGTARAG
jgi:hypothetical protein